jgi:hypothetical protein
MVVWHFRPQHASSPTGFHGGNHGAVSASSNSDGAVSASSNSDGAVSASSNSDGAVSASSNSEDSEGFRFQPAPKM